MNGTRRRGLALLLVLFLPGCGGSGGSPTGPSGAPSGLPAGSTLTVVSGENGRAVAGARVSVGGKEYTSDPSGLVRLTDAVNLNSRLDVVQGDYLDRETLVRSTSDTRYTLWPRSNTHGLTEDFTERIVYTDTSVSDDAPGGGSPLYRLAPGRPAALRPSAEILNDPKLRPLVEEAADIANDASGEDVFFMDASGSAPGPVFTIELRPQDAGCDEDTYAFVTYSGGSVTIDGGKVIFCESLSYFRQAPASRDLRNYFLGTLVHEIGHAYGLGHSTSERDLMYSGGHWYKYERDHRFYSERETTVMRLMWLRRAGTQFPDNDRSATGTLGRFTRTIRN